MKLENIYPQKKNTRVTVLGTVYEIGSGGFIVDEDGEPLDVPEIHAERLLQGKAWRALEWDPDDPKNSGRFGAPGKLSPAQLGRPARSRLEIEGYLGKPMGTEPVGASNDAAPEGDALEALEKADEEKRQESAKLAGEATPPEVNPPDAEGEETEAESDAEGVAGVPDESPARYGENGEWEVPTKGGEWPDPSPEMPREYLEQMADVYQVKHDKRCKDETLVKRITDAMYPKE